MSRTSNMLISLYFGLAIAAVGGAAAADTPAAGAPAAGTPAAVKPGATSSAQIEAGEPRADTSSPAAAPAPVASEPVPGGATAASSARSNARTAPARPAAAAGRTPKGNDRVDLNTATVTGDREQPKVMYIVPWKRSDIGDLSGKPMNSLVDEALAPVDRDEFRREVAYYGAVKAISPENGPSQPAADQGEK